MKNKKIKTTFQKIGKKFVKINQLINSQQEVPAELTKNFLTFPLTKDPFNEIE